MSGRLLLLVAGLLLLPTIPGCRETAALLEADRLPSASVRSVRLQSISPQSVTIAMDVQLQNPYSFPLPLQQAEYSVTAADRSLLQGSVAAQTTIPAGHTQLVPVKLIVPVDAALRTMRDIKPGSIVPYEANLNFTMDIPGRPDARIKVQHAGQLPIPAPPQVELLDLHWQTMSLAEATALIRLRVHNTNQFAFELTQFSYTLWLSDWELSRLKLNKPLAFDVGGSTEVSIPITVSTLAATTALQQATQSGRVTYKLTGLIEGRTPLGPLRLPFNRVGEVGLSSTGLPAEIE